MGKAKNNKFKRPRFSAEGLSVNAVKEVLENEDEVEADSPAAELLEKVWEPFLLLLHHLQNSLVDSAVYWYSYWLAS